MHKKRSKKIYWIFSTWQQGGWVYRIFWSWKKGGTHWIFWSWRKGEHIEFFDHEYIESFSLLSADTVQRDLNSLGLKDSTYNVHLPPDSGGNFFSFCKMDYARGWLTRNFRWANSCSSLNISKKHSGNWRTPTGGKEWWDCYSFCPTFSSKCLQ